MYTRCCLLYKQSTSKSINTREANGKDRVSWGERTRSSQKGSVPMTNEEDSLKKTHTQFKGRESKGDERNGISVGTELKRKDEVRKGQPHL